MKTERPGTIAAPGGFFSPAGVRARVANGIHASVFLFGVLFLFSLITFTGTLSAADAPSRFTVLSYNVYNFLAADQEQVKSEESRGAVIDILASLSPDIMVLLETGGKETLDTISAGLAEKGHSYPFASVVEGADPVRRIGILAKFAAQSVEHNIGGTYRLRDRDVPVQRGFGHCIFRWDNGYVFHLLAAHLKSKHFDPLGQTDMRRYEARLLRYMYDDILEKDPQANVLIVGDFNDTPDSSPISTLCGRRYKRERQLYDLRPVDSLNLCWTHCWDEADTYSRIDYAFAGYALLPEVLLDETYIPFPNEWSLASDHRLLLVTVVPREQPVTEAILGRFSRNARITSPLESSFHEGRIVGSRKARKP